MTAPPKAGSNSALERPHVLVVSDDKGLTSFLAEGLLLGGFWTSAVASALQTLEVFRLRTFDLMLLDAALAGMSALELVRRLRGRSNLAAPSERPPRTDIPIVLIAAAPSEVAPGAAQAAGADGILLAPLDLDDIVPHLHRIVQEWRRAHPDRPWADAATLLKPPRK